MKTNEIISAIAVVNANLNSIIRDEPVTAGALRAEVREIMEQLDVAKDMIDNELNKRLGD